MQALAVLLAQDGFIGSWPFFGLGVLIVGGLLGALWYLRNKQGSED